jgi:hypothetical protein
MKGAIITGFVLCFFSAAFSIFAQQGFAGGVVYGEKAAFSMSAPNGWVLDNESGRDQGMACVLYPKGQSWSGAKTVMYAEIADVDDVNLFVATAIKEMKAKYGLPKEKIASGKTKDGHDYFINEYPATKTNSEWARVAYVQLPQGVAYIVLSSHDKASYQKHSGVLEQMLKDSFVYLKPKFENKSN